MISIKTSMKKINQFISIVLEACRNTKDVKGTSARLKRDLQINLSLQLEEAFQRNKHKFRNGQKIKVRMVYAIPSYWQSWASVYDELKSRNDIDLNVIYMSLKGHPKETNQHAGAEDFLINNNIPFTYADDFDPSLDNPDIVIFQCPYNWYYDTVYGQLRVELLKGLGIRTCYIPYGIEFDDSHNSNKIQNLHCSHPLQKYAWRVFATHTDVKLYFAKYCITGSAHVKSFGHPKFDTYAYPANVVFENSIKAKASGRKIVLFQIHSPNNSDCKDPKKYHTLQFQEISKICKYLSSCKDVYSLITFHPAFESRVIELKKATAKDFAALKDYINQSNNAEVFVGNYQDAIKIADAYISEISSLLVEMAYMEKPTMFLYDQKVTLKRFTETLSSGFFNGNKLEHVQNFIKMIVNGSDNKRERRREVKKQIFTITVGEIGKRIVDDIINDYKMGR